MTLKEYLTEWHESRIVLLKKSTYEAEEIYLFRHIIPYFEEVCPMLENIKPIMVQNYIRSKLKDGRKDGREGGLSPVSVRKHLSIIKQALDEAVIFGYISQNPASVVKPPKRTTPVTERAVFLNAKDAQRLLDAFRDSELYLVVALALIYGLRRSEVLGLRWQAIDFKKNTITICHTVVKNITIEKSDSTKTANSRRTFPLWDNVREALEELKKKRKYGNEYLFCKEDGTVWRPDTVTRKFEREVVQKGFPKMRFHDLRHSTASLLFDSEWSIEDIKNWLGHADIETTSNIYLHYNNKRKVLVANNLSSILVLRKSTV